MDKSVNCGEARYIQWCKLRSQQFCFDRLDACRLLRLLLDFPRGDSLLHVQPAFRCRVEKLGNSCRHLGGYDALFVQ